MHPEKKKKLIIPKNTWVVNKFKKHYQEFKKLEATYRHSLHKIEEAMQKEFKTKEIEFIIENGKIIGIGTPTNPKILRIIKLEEMEG